MAGRKVVPIDVNKKHFTNEQRQQRQTAESALKGPSNRIWPPSWLDDTARREFRRLAAGMSKLNILCNADVGGLAVACDAYSKYIMATRAITETTINVEVTRTDGTMTAKRNPLNAVEKYANIYRQYCAEFGLTPAARIKISANLTQPKERPKNPMEAAGFDL